ncbi:MAG: hypothetical protein HeimC2_39970 [Candidatus Heimdallarchaeota archaeon LC_2]|nr:MAG: hypothetical protein HeimC2_39970 [Candidatus Heimdallarchaeota archaeon LC_2]
MSKKEKKPDQFFAKSSGRTNEEQWFPHQPANSPSRLMIVIALLDEIFIFAILFLTAFVIYNRFR